MLMFLNLPAVVFMVMVVGNAGAQEASTKDLNTLSMEIAAMQKLDGLAITPVQLKLIAGWVNETAEKPRDRDPARVNLKFRKAMLELHAALAHKKGTDDIVNLQIKATEIKTTDAVELDDDHGITESAKKRAPELYRQMKTAQVFSLLTSVDDSEPEEELLSALNQSRELKDKEWRDARDETAAEAAAALAGVDGAKAARINEQVKQFLDKAHALTEDEFTKKKAELRQEIEKVAASAQPLDVLYNRALLNLARFLSSPALPAVVEIRLKK